MVVHPVIVGHNSYNMFAHIQNNVGLKLLKTELIENKYFWLIYSVEK